MPTPWQPPPCPTPSRSTSYARSCTPSRAPPTRSDGEVWARSAACWVGMPQGYVKDRPEGRAIGCSRSALADRCQVIAARPAEDAPAHRLAFEGELHLDERSVGEGVRDRVGGRLALWGRRLMGEALTQAQRVAACSMSSRMRSNARAAMTSIRSRRCCCRCARPSPSGHHSASEARCRRAPWTVSALRSSRGGASSSGRSGWYCSRSASERRDQAKRRYASAPMPSISSATSIGSPVSPSASLQSAPISSASRSFRPSTSSSF